MLPPPDIFNPARTHCPSCNATLTVLSENCAFCGFSAQICMQRYPFSPPPLTRIVDPDGSVKPVEAKKMTKAIARLEKRFPQITVSVCVMNLPEGVDGREFGYWYLNRGEVHDEREMRRRMHHLLLIVNRTNHTVSVSVGYGLDCFLHDQFLHRTLERTAGTFASSGYAVGVANWLKSIRRELLSVQYEAQFAQKRWVRHHGSSESVDDANATRTVSEGYRDAADSAPKITPRPRQSKASHYSSSTQ